MSDGAEYVFCMPLSSAALVLSRQCLNVVLLVVCNGWRVGERLRRNNNNKALLSDMTKAVKLRAGVSHG